MVPSEIEDIKQDRRERALYARKKSFIDRLKKRHGITYEQYLKQHRDTTTSKKWAIFFDECVDCGSTQHKHHVAGRCVKCSVAYYKDRPSVVESQRKSSIKYAKKNKEKLKQYSKEYYYKNRGRLLKKTRERYAKNKDTG